MQIFTIELVLLRLLDGFLRVVYPIERKIIEHQVAVVGDHVRVQAQALFRLRQGLLELPQLGGQVPLITDRDRISGIAPGPDFVHLEGLVQLAGDATVVHAGNSVFFPFTDAIAQRIGLLEIFRSQTGLIEIAVNHPQARVGYGEIRIQFESAPEEWNRLGISLGALG